MPGYGSPPANRALGALIHDLVDESRRLLQQEWKLAKLELKALGARIGTGTLEIAVGGVCLALGGMSVLVGVAIALADPWMHTHVDLAIAFGVVILISFVTWLAKAGIEALVTVDSVDEKPMERAAAWHNQPHKSVATSN